MRRGLKAADIVAIANKWKRQYRRCMVTTCRKHASTFPALMMKLKNSVVNVHLCPDHAKSELP